MKKYLLVFMGFLGFGAGALFYPQKASAQVCSGSYNDSYTQYSCDSTCEPPPPLGSGTCTYSCNGFTNTNSQGCSGSGGPGWDCLYDFVRINDQCTPSAGGCTITSSQPAPIPDAGTCPAPKPPPSPANCGNGTLNSGEQCDDGNTVSGDGCSSVCTIESVSPTCGDGPPPDPGEQCDDGNNVDGDGCSSACTIEVTGCTGGSVCISPAPASCAAVTYNPGSGICDGGLCCDPPSGPPPHSCEVNPAGSTFTSGLIVMGTGDIITVKTSVWGTPDGGEVTARFEQSLYPVTPPGTQVLLFGPLKRVTIGRKSQMDATFTYSVYGNAPGQADITTNATVFGNSCSGNNNVRIAVIPGPWFQVKGDIFAIDSIDSSLPTGTNLIKNNVSGFPGIGIYGASSTITTGAGDISTTQWAAASDTTITNIDYNYFKQLVNPTTLSASSGNTIANVVAGGYINPSDNTVWIDHVGDWNINGSLVLPAGRKVVVFVNGAVNVNANVRLNDPKTSLFMVIATGDITVSNIANITIGGTNHALEGLFYTDGRFVTLFTNIQLSVYGSVYASDFDLQRNLGIQNSNLPAEKFELNEALLLNFPTDIVPKKVVWKEVLP